MPAPRKNVVLDTASRPARNYFEADLALLPPIIDTSFKSCASDWMLPASVGPSAAGHLPDPSASSVPFRDQGPRSRRMAEGEEWRPAIGEQVYYCAGRQSFPNGDVLRFGAPGHVVSVVNHADINESPFRHNTTYLVEAFFEANKQHVCLRSTELCDTRPEMPSGFHVGDVVVFCGKRPVKVSETDVLRPGLRGEVVGRAARRGGKFAGDRLSVLFEGHTKNTPIPTTAVRLEEVVIDIDDA